MPTIQIEREAYKSLEADGRLGTIAVIDDTVYMDPDSGAVLKRKRHRRVITLSDDIDQESQVIQRLQAALIAANPGVEDRWAQAQAETEG